MAQVGATHFHDAYLEDIHISEKEKMTEWYLKDNIDYWIANLVREKTDIKTMRDYYHGIRDQREFEYLTENFGIGTPSKLKFTPLIKPRIDALLGKIESESFTYKVACLDDKTISTIEEEKKTKKLQEIESAMDRFIQHNMQTIAKQGNEIRQGAGLAEDLKRVQEKFSTNYLSDFEIACQDLLNFFEQDNHLDLKQKLKQLALDLLVTGQCYYRVYCERIGDDPVLEVVKPENIFYNKNTNSQYIDTCDAIVRREYLTRKDILRKYGKYMSDDQKHYIFGNNARVRTSRSLRSGTDLELYYNDEDPVQGQKSYTNLDVVEVFHVEWKALNKIEISDEEIENQSSTKGYQSKVQRTAFREDRYEGTRIAGSIYVNCGRSEHMVRSRTRPLNIDFTYNGVVYNDRNGKPYSIVASMKDLQDVYDLTQFYRDVMIANSGVAGDRINIAGIPKQLGNKFMERLMKFIALKKNGFELIDPTEPGAQLFNHYGSYDNSVNGGSLQAIQSTLEAMERQADIIAGTNPGMLGQIAERDAVTNVKQGIQQSLLINEDLFGIMRTNTRRLLTDMIRVAQRCYKKGKKGSYIMGAESYVFYIAPEYFCFTDYAIGLTNSSEDEVNLQTLKEIGKEFVGAELLEPDVLIHILLSDSTTEIKEMVSKAVRTKKKENDQLGQASQQLEQMQQQLKELESQLQQANNQLQSNEQKNQAIREQEAQAKIAEAKAGIRQEDERIRNDKEYKDADLELTRERTELEREQLYLGTGAEKEIRNT